MKMRTIIAIVFLPSLVGACTTPMGVPCMTVEAVNEHWNFLNRGLNYHHSKFAQRTDLAANGSARFETTSTTIPLLGAPNPPSRHTELYLAPSDRVVHIFHNDRTFSNREPLIWHDRPYRRSKVGDKTCATGILHSGTDFQQTGEEMILGTKVFRWFRPLANGGYEEQFLAPALDCLPLRAVRVYKNFLHIPVNTHRMEVTSVRFGEPDPSLFHVPPDFRQVPDPFEERLRRR